MGSLFGPDLVIRWVDGVVAYVQRFVVLSNAGSYVANGRILWTVYFYRELGLRSVFCTRPLRRCHRFSGDRCRRPRRGMETLRVL